ncbi:MAG TPA: class I SAM-dependent methyltransferase [Candidatus Nanoarchaeia archaeon]|nr:class I SAM-dependent methyltransferase [Candidatus Nanoarchaeia archaeon]
MANLMYNQLAKYTDLLYSSKDYQKEVDFILRRIKESNLSGKILTDVACGSGNHAKIFQKYGYQVYGVDLNQGMLNLARKNVPKIKLYRQDLRKLDLKIKADVILCMFNSINYNFSYSQLKSTLKLFHRHLNRRGMVVFDTMFTEDNWVEGYFGAEQFRFLKLDLSRISKSSSKNNIGTVDQTYVIFDHGKKKIFENVNQLFIFDKNKIKKLMEEVGFRTKLYNNFSDGGEKISDFPVTVFVGIKG